MPATASNEEAIFHAVLALDDADQRSAYLDAACGNQPELRRRVEALIRRCAEAQGPLDRPLPTPVVTTDEANAEPPGTVIGPYKLLEQIGEGGFGIVFMAEQQGPIRRKVALKVLKPGMDTRQVIARFEAERQALALMDPPHIARVFDGGATAGGRPYFVMELVKGIPITDFCDQSQLTARQRLELFLSVCHAVQHAHQKGIIHRDLKPSNVLVTVHDGTPVVKVIDFGIAKATGQQLTDKTLCTGFGQMIGTPLYMSPEQAALSGLDVDTRSDIYALGVLLYELLTGTTPFDKERLREAGYDEMRRIIREEEPPRPSTRVSTLGPAAITLSTQRKSDPKRLSQLFRGELDWIVMKCLEKDRNRRYETANALARDLEHYLHDEAVDACPPSAAYRLRKFLRRNKPALTIAGLALLILMTVAGSVGWIVRDRAARQAEITRQVRDSLTAARTLLADNQVARARQKLAESRSRIGEDRALLGSLAEEVEALDAELSGFARFLELYDQAYELEFPRAVMLVLQADGARSSAAAPPQEPLGGDPAKAVPLLHRSLSCYGILEHDDWIAPLEGGLLGPDQRAQVRRTVYEELLWLAGDLVTRGVDHQSGQKVSKQEAAHAGLAYLRKAEAAHRPTSAFYQVRARCRQALGEERTARMDEDLARKTRGVIALDHYLLGRTAYDGRDEAEAARQFEAALRLEPTHYWSLMRLGLCLTVLGQSKQHLMAAVTAFTGCIMKRPNNAVAWNCRGVAYDRLGQHDKALADTSRGIELDPKIAVAWYNRACLHLQLGQHDKALADFSKSIELDPKDGDAWNNRGIAHKYLGQVDNAIADYSKAIERLSQGPEPSPMHLAVVWNNRGLAYGGLGQLDKAIDDFSTAIQLDPKAAGAWINRGTAQERLGQLDRAIADHSTGIALDPKNGLGFTNRGIAYCKRGQLDKAIVDFSMAVQLIPDGAVAHCQLGGILATCSETKLRDPRRAVAHAKRAVELDPQSSLAWQFLGWAQYRAGDWQASIEGLEKSCKLQQDGGDCGQWIVLALAHEQLATQEGLPEPQRIRHRSEARQWYGQAAKQTEGWRASKDFIAQAILTFRAEAEQLLGIRPQD